MDLTLSADEQHIQEAIRGFVAASVTPLAGSWSHAGALPDAIFEQLADLGVFGVAVGEEAGGVGLGSVAAVVVAEALAWGDGSLALAFAQHTSACRALAAAELNEQLEALALGTVLGTWAGPSALDVTASEGADGWTLTGTLRCLPLGRRAGVLVLPAASDAGEGLFVVATAALPAGASSDVDTMGMLGLDFVDIDLTAAPPQAITRVGDFDADQAASLAAFDQTTLAAIAVGLGTAALEQAAAYALDRKQFGKPIAEFQAIQHKLADAATGLEGSQLLVWRAAARLDGGRPARGEAAMARVAAAEASRFATDEAIQVHGGYGYTREYPVERLWRDAKWCTVAGASVRGERDALANVIYGALA